MLISFHALFIITDINLSVKFLATFHFCEDFGWILSQEYHKPYGQENLGPVVQSVVSLTSSLRVILLTILVDSIYMYNILIFFAEKMWVAFALQKLLTFFQQNISAYLRITWCKF